MKPAQIDTILLTAEKLKDSDGLRAGCEAIIDDVTSCAGATASIAAILAPDNTTADIIGASGIGSVDYRRLESRIAKSQLWRAMTMGVPVAVDNVADDPALAHLAYGAGIRVMIAVPIRLKNNAVGLLAAGYRSEARIDEAIQVKFLSVIASLIAQSMKSETANDNENRKLAEENLRLRQQLRGKYDFDYLIGNSSLIRSVYDRAIQIARTNRPILLRGESGSGKNLLANVIHFNSLRSSKPIVTVNGVALSDDSAEGELRGYENNADQTKTDVIKGKLEQADGGTLVIDGLSQLPLRCQETVLSAVKYQNLVRIGGTDPVTCNFRLIVCESDGLESEVETGRTNLDLFDLFKDVTIHLPPLRDRRSDILLLAEHFLEKYTNEHKKNILRISTPAIDMLTAYHFPGNVRELENVIERSVLECDGNVIHGHHLPPTLQTAEISDTVTRLTLATAVESFEKDLIQDALKSAQGNIAKAARMLDSTERILGYKIGKYRLDPNRFKRWRISRH